MNEGLPRIAADAERAARLAAYLRQDPGNPVLAGELAHVQVRWLRGLHRAARLGEAWDWILAAQRSGALQPAARGVAALIAVDRGDFVAARRWSDGASRDEGAGMEALVAQGTVALAARQVRLAVQAFERALRIGPRDGRALGGLGLAWLLSGDLARARQHLEQAVARVPAHVGTWHALGWTRLLQGDAAGALQAFRRALQEDRNFAESHGAVGLALAHQGQADEARRHLDLADRLDPSNVTARYARAVLAGEAGDAARLAALARRLLDRPGFFGGRLHDSVLAPAAESPEP